MQRRKFGWHPSLPGIHHKKWIAPHVAMPVSADLSPSMPPVYDQGQLGSCVDNAVAGACQYDEIKQGNPDTNTPSRLFLYYGARSIEGTVSSDSGSSVADGCNSAAQWGYPDESAWPYDVSQYTIQPPASVYDAAKPNAITNFAQVSQDETAIKTAVATGFPVLIGFTCYPSLETSAVDQTGDIPMPSAQDQKDGSIGGHSVLVVGYDDTTRRFKIRNSWGSSWGKGGYGTLPYDYLLNADLAGDFWVINAVPGGSPTPTPVPPSPPPPTPTPAPPTPPDPTPLFVLPFKHNVPKGHIVAFFAPVTIPAGTYDVTPEAAPSMLHWVLTL